MDFLELHNVVYKIDKKIILDDINLTFTNGIYALVGLNGAGKTTLFNVISTLVKPTSGTMSYNNEIINNPSKIRKSISYMSQNIGLIQVQYSPSLGQYLTKFKIFFFNF